MRLRTKILEGIKKIAPTAIGTKQCDILTNTNRKYITQTFKIQY